MAQQGDVFWLDDDEPAGSEPGFRRPYLVIQNNAVNATRIKTVLAVPMTSNGGRAAVVGNVLIPARQSGLPKDSVAIVSQVETIDLGFVEEIVGRISDPYLARVLGGVIRVIEPREPVV